MLTQTLVIVIMYVIRLYVTLCLSRLRGDVVTSDQCINKTVSFD